MKDKKEMIMRLLKNGNMFSTSKIAFIIKANQNATYAYLEELEKDKKVKRLKTPTATYWELIK